MKVCGLGFEEVDGEDVGGGEVGVGCHEGVHGDHFFMVVQKREHLGDGDVGRNGRER